MRKTIKKNSQQMVYLHQEQNEHVMGYGKTK